MSFGVSEDRYYQIQTFNIKKFKQFSIKSKNLNKFHRQIQAKGLKSKCELKYKVSISAICEFCRFQGKLIQLQKREKKTIHT